MDVNIDTLHTDDLLSEESILADFSSKDNSITRQAAFSAANANLTSALPMLVSLFESESLGVQEACEFAVRKIRGPQAINLVIPYIRSEDATIRNIAMDILRDIGTDNLESIIALIEDQDTDVRIFTADILGSSASPLALSPLCRALLDDPEVNVRYQAAISIGALQNPEAADFLRKALHDEEWVQYAVIEALAKIRDASCVDILLHALPQTSPLIASMIIDALGDIANIKAAPPLLNFIDNSSGPLQTKALKATIQILGPNSLALLGAHQLTTLQVYMIKALTEQDEDTLKIVLQGLASTGINPEATKAVLKLVISIDPDSQPELLQNALDCIIKIGYNEELEYALESDNDNVRKLTIEACGMLEGKAGRFALKRHFEMLSQTDKNRAIELLSLGSDNHDIPFFIHYLDDSQDPIIICAALNFLGTNQRHLPVAENMLAFLKHANATVRDAALEACISLEDEQTVFHIVSLVNDNNAEMRKVAVYTMGRINAIYFLEQLTKAMDDSCESVRKTALQGIGYGLQSGDTKNSILILAVSDEAREVRRTAVEFLRDNITPETIPAILTALADSDDWVKMRALDALGEHQIKSALPIIIEMMQDSSTLVQLEIIKTIARFGNDLAFQTLLHFMSYDDSEVQQAAQEAIANITRDLGATHE